MTTTIRSTLLRLAATAAAAMLALTLAPAAAQAQVIEGCYVPKSGSVYRINGEGTPTACAKSHKYFSWNVEGPKGEKGDKGDKGDTGDVGPQGPAGTLGPVTFVNGTYEAIAPGEFGIASQACPAGTRPVGGGFNAQNSSQPRVTASMPFLNADGTMIGWQVRAHNDSAQHILYLEPYALCAGPSA